MLKRAASWFSVSVSDPDRNQEIELDNMSPSAQDNYCNLPQLHDMHSQIVELLDTTKELLAGKLGCLPEELAKRKDIHIFNLKVLSEPNASLERMQFYFGQRWKIANNKTGRSDFHRNFEQIVLKSLMTLLLHLSETLDSLAESTLQLPFNQTLFHQRRDELLPIIRWVLGLAYYGDLGFCLGVTEKKDVFFVGLPRCTTLENFIRNPLTRGETERRAYPLNRLMLDLRCTLQSVDDLADPDKVTFLKTLEPLFNKVTSDQEKKQSSFSCSSKV